MCYFFDTLIVTIKTIYDEKVIVGKHCGIRSVKNRSLSFSTLFIQPGELYSPTAAVSVSINFFLYM
jgi:hypothetical protein